MNTKFNYILIFNIKQQLRNKFFWIFAVLFPLMTIIIFKISNQYIKIDETSEKILESNNHFFKVLVSGIFWFLMYTSLIQHILKIGQNIFEERKNRIIELLLTSISPKQLIWVKIVSVCALSIIQFFISLIVFAFILVIYDNRLMILSSFNTYDILFWIVSLIIYFSLGILFYTSLGILLGIIFRKNQEIQISQFIMTFLLIVPMFFVFELITNPNGTLMNSFSINPFFTSTVSPIKLILAKITFLEFVSTLLITIFSCIVIIEITNKLLIKTLFKVD